MDNKSASRGLTLIELLVAISIFGLLAVLGWRGLDSIVRARIALTGNLEQTRNMQLTFAQLQSDCTHLASDSLLKNRTALAAHQGQLSLIRTVLADNQPLKLQVVTYRIKGEVLTRYESMATRDLRELDGQWLVAANNSDTAQAVKLQTGVSSMMVRLWDSGGWHPPSMGAPPPATLPNPIASASTPTGLEVTLQLPGQDHSLVKIFMLGAV